MRLPNCDSDGDQAGGVAAPVEKPVLKESELQDGTDENDSSDSDGTGGGGGSDSADCNPLAEGDGLTREEADAITEAALSTQSLPGFPGIPLGPVVDLINKAGDAVAGAIGKAISYIPGADAVINAVSNVASMVQGGIDAVGSKVFGDRNWSNFRAFANFDNPAVRATGYTADVVGIAVAGKGIADGLIKGMLKGGAKAGLEVIDDVAAGTGKAAKNADFAVGPNGVAIPLNKQRQVEGYERAVDNAGWTKRPARSNGTIYHNAQTGQEYRVKSNEPVLVVHRHKDGPPINPFQGSKAQGNLNRADWHIPLWE